MKEKKIRDKISNITTQQQHSFSRLRSSVVMESPKKRKGVPDFETKSMVIRVHDGKTPGTEKKMIKRSVTTPHKHANVHTTHAR